MKKQFRIFAAFLTFVLLISIHNAGVAQPPPPPPTGGHGLGGNQPAGAPIGNGTYILLALAGVYGLRKVYVLRTADKEVKE